MRISGNTRICGVFGWPVRHSLSPPMQQAAFDALNLDWAYLPFAVAPENLERALRALPALGMAGVNCTIPHKESTCAIVNQVDAQAAAIGAVNTVTVLEDGRLEGMNTDARGFVDSLRLDGGFEPADRTVVMIGTGGAGRAMAFGLADAGVSELILVNRTLERAERLAEDLHAYRKINVRAVKRGAEEEVAALAQADLLVNASSLGLHDVDTLPADPAHLRSDAAVYDAVYTPQWTPLLQAAALRGLKTIPGLGMLARQGAIAFERWTGQKPDVQLMIDTLKRELAAR